jgi:type VI secretion system secreted protein Hcp
MASDYLLEIEGIKGESKDSKHPEAIEVETFSWTSRNDGSFAHGSGGGAGKVTMTDLHITAQVNKASALLFMACVTGKHLSKAQLFARKQGEDQQDYYVVTLNDCLVSAFQSAGSNGAHHLPTDQFSLNFAKFKFEYKSQSNDGSLAAPITSGWDLKGNKKL